MPCRSERFNTAPSMRAKKASLAHQSLQTVMRAALISISSADNNSTNAQRIIRAPFVCGQRRHRRRTCMRNMARTAKPDLGDSPMGCLRQNESQQSLTMVTLVLCTGTFVILCFNVLAIRLMALDVFVCIFIPSTSLKRTCKAICRSDVNSLVFWEALPLVLSVPFAIVEH